MVRKAGLIALLALSLCCAHVAPGSWKKDGEAADREGIPSKPAPVWILIDKIYRGTKWVRIRGKGLAGDIKIERIGKTPVSVEWKIFYGKGAGRGHKKNPRGPKGALKHRNRGKNGYRFWVRMRW